MIPFGVDWRFLVTLKTKTQMFNSNKVVPAFANLLGWRQFYDTSEIEIDTTLTTTETGEYFQQKHPALALNYIQALIAPNYGLDIYLRDVVTESTNEILNDLLQYRQVNEYGKTLLEQSTLLNRYGWKNDVITNENRFVGFQIKVKTLTGLQNVVNEIGLQLNSAETLTLYLFHSSKSAPVTNFDITTTASGNWQWISKNLELNAFLNDEFQGGVFILGYYQEDLTGNAINYSNFDWTVGECSSCPSSAQYAPIWKSIRNYFNVFPIYVPAGSFEKGQMFDLNDMMFSQKESFGLNLKFTVRCDLTSFFITNKFAFKNLLGLKVTEKVLGMMKFSQQLNTVEERIKNMIIRDLEGDIDTKLKNIPTRYQNELKAVAFNTSAINAVCLGCESDSYTPNYGTV